MGKAQVLVVEDNRIVAKDIENSLKNLGFDVCGSVPSGEEALEKAEEQRPDLVLMDIMLKGEMNGTEAAGQIHSRLNIPVVYLTAYADEGVLEKAKKTEPFGYIIKPFEERELNTAIEIALYKHKMERKLRESEQWFSTTLKSIGDAVITTDKEGRVTFMNPVAESLTGWRQGEARGKCLKEVFHIINEETREEVEDPVAEVLREGAVVGLANHTVLIARGGSEVYIADSGAPIRDEKGEITGVVLVFRDVSERRRAEEALRNSEEKYRGLFDESIAAVYLFDNKKNFLDSNQAGLDLLGYSREELLNMSIPEVDADLIIVLPAHEQLLSGDRIINYEHKLRRKDGKVITVLNNSRPLTNNDQVVGMQSTLIDITNRKQAEEQVAIRDRAIASASDGVLITDPRQPDNPVIYCNQAFQEMTGYARHETLGQNCRFLQGNDHDQDALKVLRESISDQRSCRAVLRNFKKDGTLFHNELTISPVVDEDGRTTHFVGILNDITERVRAEEERQRLEEQLQKARKMEAMGLMAGGIAHDLNNILSGIVSYPELLLMDLPEDSPMRKPIKTMQDSGMRAADVVADLMTIARGVATSKEPLNLNTVVGEYLESVEHQKLERTHSFVEFRAELDSDLLNMRGSLTHINKTLMNLVANATEAIEGSGTVTIFTRNQYLDEPLKGYEDVRIGEYGILTVSDDGAGISPKDLERIFEPFYTKKVMDRGGTGLGLAVVWNAVQDHKGYIDVKSGEKGTVFELYFPVTREQIAEDKEDVPVEEYQGHGEKILVVDDEENQREIACDMLTKLGYNAESVSSGEEAIEYVKKNPVDLIVLDMVMPKGINGRKTYEEIIKICPGQKAIIASGYAKTNEVDRAQELGAGKYIKKPYVLEKIGIAVKEELKK